jgi:P27 family predicted phage terminase small subunit
MGRLAKPTAIRRLEGNRGHRPFNDREPVVFMGEPPMPTHLGALERREWRRFVPLLLDMGVLAESDGTALTALCSSSATIIRAQMELQKLPSLLMKTGPNGYTQQHPLLGVIHSERKVLIVLLREFGLTPSSRSRVETINPEYDADGMDALERALCGD